MSIKDNFKKMFIKKDYDPIIKHVEQNPARDVFRYMNLEKGGLIENTPQSISNYYRGLIANIISKISSDVGNNVPLLSKTGKEVKDDLTLLLNKPSPVLSWQKLTMQTNASLDLFGEAVWYLRQMLSGASYIDFIPISNINIEFTDSGYKYTLMSNARAENLDPSKVILFITPNALDPYRGLSPIYANRDEVTLYVQALRYRKISIESSSKIAGWIKPKYPVTKDQKKQIKAQTNLDVNGIENAGKWVVVDPDQEMQELGQTASELEFAQTYPQIVEAIYSIWGVSPAIMGVVKDVNRANNEAQMKLYQSSVIIPRRDAIAKAIKEKLFPIFYGTSAKDYDIKLHGDMILPLEEKVVKTESMSRQKAITINEVRNEFGYQPIKNGDVRVVSFTDMELPLGSVNSAPVEANKSLTQKSIIPVKKEAFNYPKFYRSHVNLLNKSSVTFERDITSIFDKHWRSMLTAMLKTKSFNGKSMTMKDLFDIYYNEAGLTEELTEAQLKNMLAIADTGIDSYKNLYGLSGNFDMTHQRAADVIKKSVAKYTSEISKTNVNEIRRIINDNLASGDTVEELAKKIEDILGGDSLARGMRIGRTETNMALNKSHILLIEDAGFGFKKWLTGGDNVRSSHINAEKENTRVPIAEPFVVRNEETGKTNLMSAPGDPTADVEEVVNCKCVSAGILE